MRLNGRDYSKSEIIKRVGNINQVGGTRHYELIEGSSRGTRAIDVNTGSGFRYTIVPDRGMDISIASFMDTNLVYQTSNGEVNPSFYESFGAEWLRSFFAGLLTTCGLTYLGEPGVDEGVSLGLHGRHSNIPARNVCDLSGWEGDEYSLSIRGIIEDNVLFGDKLRMTRAITSRVGEKSLNIKDQIENLGQKKSPFTILYHVNSGFPLLDGDTELIISSKEVIPLDEASRESIRTYREFTEPVPGFKECNYHHVMERDKEGYSYAAIVNRKLNGGLGLYIKFDNKVLPNLNEWKMMGCIDYVAAIEPCNTKCENRGVLRRAGKLPFINPGEVIEINLEIGVLYGKEEINSFEALLKSTVNG